MPTQRNVNDLTFTIPAYPDPADMPTIFDDYTQGMPASTTTHTETVEVTSADSNKIFEFKNEQEGDPVKVKIQIVGDGFWKEIDGKGYGMQFGVATKNNIVEIKAEEGVVTMPANAVPANSLCIVTRISPTVWLVVGGISTEGPFIFAKSKIGGGDYYA
jgi:hypothetical protein